jgi:hypothetical protein
MSQITIRDLPPEVEKTIRKESKRKGVSLNKVVVSLLERTIGVQKKGAERKIYRDLDRLSGTWSKKEAEKFENNLRSQRQIDEEIWK